ncbi:hypothetical protein D3C86_1129380 [compost metagenome]
MRAKRSLTKKLLPCACALLLQGCTSLPFMKSSEPGFTLEPAKIISISAPSQISLGSTAILTATVYAGPNGCYAVEQLHANLDEPQRRVILDAFSRPPVGDKVCPSEPAIGQISAEFQPTATGTYLVEANRFFAGYANGSASATATIVVTP